MIPILFNSSSHQLTEDLHSEEKAGASGHVGDHAAVLATVLRPNILDLQVLTPGKPLDATPQLEPGEKGRDRATERETESIR